jgi:hypothetical protein
MTSNPFMAYSSDLEIEGQGSQDTVNDSTPDQDFVNVALECERSFNYDRQNFKFKAPTLPTSLTPSDRDQLAKIQAETLSNLYAVSHAYQKWSRLHAKFEALLDKRKTRRQREIFAALVENRGQVASFKSNEEKIAWVLIHASDAIPTKVENLEYVTARAKGWFMHWHNARALLIVQKDMILTQLGILKVVIPGNPSRDSTDFNDT